MTDDVDVWSELARLRGEYQRMKREADTRAEHLVARACLSTLDDVEERLGVCTAE